MLSVHSLNGPDSGLAAQLVWNLIVVVHQLHVDYHTSLVNAEASVSL
jgi:hypothetical protein